MKLFDVDWAGVLDLLSAWSRLSFPARRRLLDTLKPSESMPVDMYGERLEETLESGILTATPTRVLVAQHARDLVRVLRAMDRQSGLFDEPSTPGLAGYLIEHFTGEDLSGFDVTAGRGHWYAHANAMAIAEQVSSISWVEGFQALTGPSDAAGWEELRGRGHRPMLSQPTVFRATQEILRLLATRPEGISLSELVDLLGGVPARTLGPAVHAALRYVLIQAVLDSETLEPRVGVWPPIARRMSAPPPAPPRPVETVDSFDAALLLEDMTVVLVAVASDPPRLRANDFEIFVRDKQTIADRLIAIPEWVSDQLGLGLDERISFAVDHLLQRKLVKTAGSGGKDLRMETSRAGIRWIGRSEEERLKALLDGYRNDPDLNPVGWNSEGADESFFPVRIDATLTRDDYDARAAVTAGLLALPGDEFHLVDDYLDFESRERNPFLIRDDNGVVTFPRPRWGGPGASREGWERAWRTVLHAFLHWRLAALGGLRLGRTSDGRISFQLTEIGRYLLGANDSFRYGHEADAEMIVQPNFEIVFLARAPRLEAQIGRFAERIGSPPGVVFRLTREAILAAAEAGVSRADLIGTLTSGSSRDLPSNVERQVDDWFGAIRHVSIQRTLLIRCPDVETAAKVRAAAGGKDARVITDTILEIPDLDAAAKRALVKKLRSAGVFVEN